MKTISPNFYVCPAMFVDSVSLPLPSRAFYFPYYPYLELLNFHTTPVQNFSVPIQPPSRTSQFPYCPYLELLSSHTFWLLLWFCPREALDICLISHALKWLWDTKGMWFPMRWVQSVMLCCVSFSSCLTVVILPCSKMKKRREEERKEGKKETSNFHLFYKKKKGFFFKTGSGGTCVGT